MWSQRTVFLDVVVATPGLMRYDSLNGNVNGFQLLRTKPLVGQRARNHDRKLRVINSRDKDWGVIASLSGCDVTIVYVGAC